MAARKSSSPRPTSGGKGKPAPKPAGRERPASRKVSAAKAKTSSGGPVAKGRNPGPSSRGPRVVDARGAARTGPVQAGPDKPGPVRVEVLDARQVTKMTISAAPRLKVAKQFANY
jgi:hypothetical protein